VLRETAAPPVPDPPPAHIDYAPPPEIGEVPETIRGTGDCALTLRLRDPDDGTPVAMYARLWRLGLADDGAWTAGDQIQARLTVGADGATIERLPAGRYRVEVPDQRRLAADPPEFTVGAGPTTKDLDVRPRRSHHVRLRVCDADGAILRHVTGEITPDDWTAPGPLEPPAWASARVPSDAPASSFAIGAGRPSRCFFGRRVFPPLDGGPDGFDLGSLRDPGRGDTPSVRCETQVDGCNDVGAWVSGGSIAGDEAVLVAVCVPFAKLEAGVERPDGTPVPADLVRRTFAVCDAVHGALDPSAEDWRRVRVRVNVAVVGFEELAYDWSVETADDRHVLVPRLAK